jgi:hypothetical protein
MEKTAFLSATYFTAFSIFLFYQQSLTRQFRGSSQVFQLLLTLFALGGTVAEIVYFLYYGWNVSWVDALLVVVASVVISGILSSIVERIIGGMMIVYIGFLAMPFLGYMMFKTIPIVA